MAGETLVLSLLSPLHKPEEYSAEVYKTPTITDTKLKCSALLSKIAEQQQSAAVVSR